MMHCGFLISALTIEVNRCKKIVNIFYFFNLHFHGLFLNLTFSSVGYQWMAHNYLYTYINV